ncbi:MAG: carboxypeptidase-like regulatory domain-containing protein [Vicinamibacterales bacterium]
MAPFARAQVQMPDPSQMSGVPLPSADLPVGTITVRVVRGTLSNNIPNHQVELVTGGSRREAATDASGRATFTGLRAGNQVQVATAVDGRRIESQTITMPAQGGVRVMLVAPDPAAAAREDENARLRNAPAAPGIVVLGGESRFIVERGDESLNVFYVLEVVNTARTPVATERPLIFDLPSGATGVTLLEGSTPQATIGGSRVTVTGPFAPGKTPLQIAYALPHRGSRVTIEQPLPAALPQLAVAGETTGGVTMSSAQFAASRDMNADGRVFVVGNGPGLPAGGVLTVSFDGLPHHPRWPRFAALAVAVIIMTLGLIMGFRPRAGAPQSNRDALIASRTARFAELEALEARRRAGSIEGEPYAEERRRLIAALEDIYTALDEQQA